jgi:putative transposase
MHKPRILVRGASYHVTARANNKQMVMRSDKTKELFIEITKRAKKKFSFEIDNFIIMGNHFHFIIRPGHRESLSRIMQWILSVFAMKYNKIHGSSGHVWGARFFSRVLNSLREFLQTFDYIDENPVEACLVPDKQEWEYSGGHFRQIGSGDFLSRLPHLILGLFPNHTPLLLAE